MLMLNPGGAAELATARRDHDRALARVVQDERIYGREHVAKVHLRALSDAALRVLYLTHLIAAELT